MFSRTSPRLTFTYDDQNRVTSGYGQSFTWESRGVLDALNGQDFAPDPLHSHAVEKLDGVRRYVYDRNGSMTVRNLGLAGWEQTLLWDSHNRLAQMAGAGASESYLYDETGQRLRKTNLLPPYTSTDYLFPGYERTDSGVVTKHYTFNGVPVAVRTGGNEPTLLYQDGVGSTVYTTNVWGSVTSARGYYAFGATRFREGTMPTDRHFTSQREDGTGLYYYGARYYDPLIGQFISPDTIVPDPTQLIDYNRYLYARGNPLKYNDPSGHFSEEQLSFFGITRDQVSDTIWDFLQRLEPQDRITGDSFSTEVGLAAYLSTKTSYSLIAADKTPLVEWLTGHEPQLSTASISRLTPDGYAEVWRQGQLVRPELDHTYAQTGFQQGPWGAWFQSLGGNLLNIGASNAAGAIPVVGNIASVVVDLSSTVGEPCAGCSEGDISLSFVCPGAGNKTDYVTTRSMWYRISYDGGMARLEQTWDQFYVPNLAQMPPDYTFSITP